MKLNKKTGRRVQIYLDPSTHRKYTDELLRIISDVDFARAQSKIAKRSINRRVTHAGRSIRPFTGLIFCQGCGNVFYAQKSTNGGHHYYVCSCRQRSGRSACPTSVTHREDILINEVRGHLSFIFSDTDAIVRETMDELERQVTINKDDAGRIKTELAAMNQQMVGYAAILVDPNMSKAVKSEIQLLVERISADRAALHSKCDQLVDRASRGADRMLEGTRRALNEAKASFMAVAKPDELHALVERFVGRSLSTPEGRLLPFRPETDVGTDVHVSAHSNIAATCLDTVGTAIRRSFWMAYNSRIAA